MGLRVLEIPTDPRTGMDLDALEAAFKSRAVKACLAMQTFQSPLGARMPDQSKRSLAKLVERYEIPLIENDLMAEHYFDGAPPRSVRAFDRSGHVLQCGSLSFCVAPAYQVGWIAAGRYHRQVTRAKILLSLSTATACQAVMAEYLAHGALERHLRRLGAALATRCEAMALAISEDFPAGCRMTRPGGGFVLWVELPRGTDSLKLYRLAFARGVCFAPGPMFSARRQYGNCIRLNFGYASVPKIREGIRTIAELIGRAST